MGRRPRRLRLGGDDEGEATVSRLLWDERDHRYGLSKNQLTEVQVETVRQWRMTEATNDTERHIAQTWTPPPFFNFEVRPYNRKGT